MSVLYIMLPAALLIAAAALAAFVRAARAGQYDDLDTPPLRMLPEDDRPLVRSRDRGESPPEAESEPKRSDRP